MPLQTYIPSPPLCEFINMFWAWDDYAPPHTKERILPFGMMELTINLADTPMCIMYPHDNFRPHLFHTPFVGGARSEFFVVDTSCPANLLSVWFRAGGALAFLAHRHQSCKIYICPSTPFGEILPMTSITNCAKQKPHKPAFRFSKKDCYIGFILPNRAIVQLILP